MANTILAIDDDNAITDLLAVLLRAHGFNVLTANTGEQGLKLIRENILSVVILDLMMPGMDGRQTCIEVRKFSRVPIMILSALDDPDVVAGSLDAGADDFLVKPVPSAILIAHVNKLIRRTGALNGNRSDSTPIQPSTQPLPS